MNHNKFTWIFTHPVEIYHRILRVKCLMVGHKKVFRPYKGETQEELEFDRMFARDWYCKLCSKDTNSPWS